MNKFSSFYLRACVCVCVYARVFIIYESLCLAIYVYVYVYEETGIFRARITPKQLERLYGRTNAPFSIYIHTEKLAVHSLDI